jgi:hypothetical protein
MIVEEVFNKRNTPPSQRRPQGHVKTGVTKKGNKKRGLRGRTVSLSDAEEGAEKEDDEDGCLLIGGRPPALAIYISCNVTSKRNVLCQPARVNLGGRRTFGRIVQHLCC